MYEFEIYNATTNEHDFIYGHSTKSIKSDYPSIDWSAWKIIHTEYID